MTSNIPLAIYLLLFNKQLTYAVKIKTDFNKQIYRLCKVILKLTILRKFDVI